jgi:hypothetical protein
MENRCRLDAGVESDITSIITIIIVIRYEIPKPMTIIIVISLRRPAKQKSQSRYFIVINHACITIYRDDFFCGERLEFGIRCSAVGIE